MSQLPEKPKSLQNESKEDDTDAELGVVESEAKGWKYKRIRLWRGLELPCYASPMVQMLLVATTCFLYGAPGFFSL